MYQKIFEKVIEVEKEQSIKTMMNKSKLTDEDYIYIVSVLEVVIAELVQTRASITLEARKKIISIAHFEMGIKMDPVLSTLIDTILQSQAPKLLVPVQYKVQTEEKQGVSRCQCYKSQKETRLQCSHRVKDGVYCGLHRTCQASKIKRAFKNYFHQKLFMAKII